MLMVSLTDEDSEFVLIEITSAIGMDIEVKVIYDVFYILSLTFFMESFAHFYIFYLEDDGVNNLEMELFV